MGGLSKISKLLRDQKIKVRETGNTDNGNDLILCVGVNVCLSVKCNYLNLQCDVEHPQQIQAEVTPPFKVYLLQCHCLTHTNSHTHIKTQARIASLSLCSTTLNYL